MERVKGWSPAASAAGRLGFVGILVAVAAMHQVRAEDIAPSVALVHRYEVTGNTLLSAAEVELALGQLPGRMSLADMQAASSRLQAAYRVAGYGAVIVLLPEQALDSGVLQLQVVEGRLRQLSVTGQQAFSRDNVLRSLPSLSLGTTPSLFDLDRELLMVNDNPAKNARVVLQPGRSAGDVEALVVVEERPVQRWLLGLDNSGTPGTGRYRTSVLYQNANLGDRDVVLGLRGVTSPTEPSQVAVLGSTLRVPLYGYKTAIEASVLASNTRSANNVTPAGDLRFSGTGLSVGARGVWMLPSLGELKSQAAFGLDVRDYKTECSLGVFGAAGCGNANNTLRVLPVTLSYSVQKLGAQFASVQYVTNVPAGSAGNDADFDASRSGARSHYQLLRLNANAIHRITPQWQLNWRADAQYAPRALVPAEQFGAAGVYSVRGYEERSLVGDSGVATSVEIRTRLDTFTGQQGGDTVPTLGVFVDAGGVSNRLGTACQPGRSTCGLWSAGFSLGWAVGPAAALQLNIARAGRAIQATERGDWKAHFSFTYSL